MPKFAAQSASVAAVALALVVVAGSASGAHAKRPRGADLTVRSLMAPAAIVRGATFRFVFTVANNGARTAKRSKVRAFLARATRRGRGDVRLLGAKSIRPLAPGAMARETGTARVPRRTGTGQWSLIVCAATERDANSRNNCRRSSRRTTVWEHYPDASNTGPTGSLMESTGNVTVSAAGTVIANRKINGCVTVRAANVTIRNSMVVCSGASAIWSGSTGLVVEDTEVDCNDAAGRTAITPARYTARRVDAHSCENIFWAESNVLIEDSYIHDPIPCCGPGEPHTDSIQIPSGASNITIRQNRIYGSYLRQSNFGNSAITAGGATAGITINDNLLAGGGYTLYCPGADGGFTWTNNRFSRIFVGTVGGFGPIYHTCAQHTNSGNVIHETGQPLNPG